MFVRWYAYAHIEYMFYPHERERERERNRMREFDERKHEVLDVLEGLEVIIGIHKVLVLDVHEDRFDVSPHLSHIFTPSPRMHIWRSLLLWDMSTLKHDSMKTHSHSCRCKSHAMRIRRYVRYDKTIMHMREDAFMFSFFLRVVEKEYCSYRCVRLHSVCFALERLWYVETIMHRTLLRSCHMKRIWYVYAKIMFDMMRMRWRACRSNVRSFVSACMHVSIVYIVFAWASKCVYIYYVNNICTREEMLKNANAYIVTYIISKYNICKYMWLCDDI